MRLLQTNSYQENKMCGIAGVFAKNPSVSGSCLSVETYKMLSMIKHRGLSTLKPQVNSYKTFSLGCIRLPIVDELYGEQPICNQSGRIVTVLNGEIYNYENLRAQYLSAKKFKTDSDTEVLANLLEEYGIEATLPLLEGMFAFIAYDFVCERYYIARDFIGIKPIYISDNGSKVLAASEIKAFDKESGDIFELPPQHYYDSHSGIKKWNTAKFSKTPNNLRDLISKSVKEQVNTSLPIAVFLSGGIDSSVICYEANQHNNNVTAFAIGKEDSNDMLTAERFCKDFNFKFEPVIINENELLNAIEDTIFSIESFEPNHIRAGTLSYLLSRHVASKGFRIALCGEGADELFAGYPDFIELLKRTDNDYSKLNSVLSIFMDELFLTQLRRVDRTGMRFSLEVRPPFLSSQIIAYANSLLPQEKLVNIDGIYITKYPLREAYREVLPSYIVDRIKSVFSEGAGFDTNGHHGPFWEFTKNKVSNSENKEIQDTYPEYHLKTHEEVYYFKIFLKYFNVHQVKPKRLFMSSV